MKHLYLAGPLTHESEENKFMDNVRNALNIYVRLIKEGYAPYCPHLSAFADIVESIGYEDWMDLDFEWLLKCDAVIRMDGISPGADREVEFAKKHNIPVFTWYEFRVAEDLL
jgi:nucleoside 2-deoxyribosyltransferase